MGDVKSVFYLHSRRHERWCYCRVFRPTQTLVFFSLSHFLGLYPVNTLMRYWWLISHQYSIICHQLTNVGHIGVLLVCYWCGIDVYDCEYLLNCHLFNSAAILVRFASVLIDFTWLSPPFSTCFYCAVIWELLVCFSHRYYINTSTFII